MGHLARPLGSLVIGSFAILQFKLLPDYHRNKTYDTSIKQVEDKTEDEEQEESCEFPGWARDMGPLISFSFSSR